MAIITTTNTVTLTAVNTNMAMGITRTATGRQLSRSPSS